MRGAGSRAAPWAPWTPWIGFLVLAAILASPLNLAAHEGGAAEGILSGLKHPVSGLDHVVAMVAVGLWGAQLGQPAVWVLPVVFPMVMAFGGMLGLLPVGASGVAYSLGFVISTGLLHAAGITIGLVHRWSAGRVALRVAGAGVAAAGVFFLVQAV